ncbi:unnamed protein product [Lactuca saligna]|uniref:Pentacotripeptide-repeat region of PRORP domain-containing protein n=1 Tax=Lactuca saligna TaxID=75948 RepID=A0AA36E912_LACSI|nr:unnamed protein product [Lactuca saligna]
MTVARLILRSLRRPVSLRTTTTTIITAAINPQSLPLQSQTTNLNSLIPLRTFALSSAAEHLDPNIPDSLTDLAHGPRLSLHNRVQSLIRAGDLDNASALARHSLLFSIRPTVFTCNEIIASMYRTKRYLDAIALFNYFFKQSNIVPNVVSYNFLIGLIDAGRIDEAVSLLWTMIWNGKGADSHVFNNISYLDISIWIIWKKRMNSLMNLNSVAGFMMVSSMQPSWSGSSVKLLEVLLKWDKKPEAEALFNSMLDTHNPHVFSAVNSDTFNIMVNECFKIGKGSEAYSVFKKVGKSPKSKKPLIDMDRETYFDNDVMDSVFKKIFNAPMTKSFSMDTAGYSNIIMRYCENDMIDDSEKMYVEMLMKYLSPDVNIYKTLIDAYFNAGRIDKAIEKYTTMVDDGLRVIPTNANKWFSNMIENGKVLECERILTKMGKRDPKPDATTYDIVIRACCGALYYERGLFLLQQMVNYDVGIVPVLGEYALEVFGKMGRDNEIYLLLNGKCSGYKENMSAFNAQEHGGET